MVDDEGCEAETRRVTDADFSAPGRFDSRGARRRSDTGEVLREINGERADQIDR